MTEHGRTKFSSLQIMAVPTQCSRFKDSHYVMNMYVHYTHPEFRVAVFDRVEERGCFRESVEGAGRSTKAVAREQRGSKRDQTGSKGEPKGSRWTECALAREQSGIC